MNKEEIENLFKKYKVRIPKEKQGQSECYECKKHHKYSLTWTSFLYEYKENYYCFEHIINILLQQENKQSKDNWNKLKEYIGTEWYSYNNDSVEFEVARDILDKMEEIMEGDK